MQPWNLEARKLRVAVLPAVVSYHRSNEPPIAHTDPTTTTDDDDNNGNTIPPINTPSPMPPSCAPKDHQLKSYNSLYNTNNMNILYYVLKAVDTDKNRTDPTITAADNATITNITDTSSFCKSWIRNQPCFPKQLYVLGIMYVTIEQTDILTICSRQDVKLQNVIFVVAKTSTTCVNHTAFM